MIKDLFKFGKADILMWSGIGAFSIILIIAFSLYSDGGGLVVKDLFGLAVVLIAPGYVIVKLYFNDLEISENLTKNPDINRAIDLLIMSIGISIATIIPMNFVWNYMLTMGGGEELKPGGGGNLWGNVDEEEIYSGSASFRSIFTVVIVVGLAIGYKIFDNKRKEKA
ncbi:MAG: hypothetical protein EBS79_11250 [Gammaproteobacteria bacterium]|jgi:hypothetical protein|nr:hypothetical protein [Gammaproteobacteria bacterium]NBY21763.1 hypothetical protein [Gammaproteobacteria bacterium]NDE34237.1 hypothetical protein [Gammaproteobacteria bacterium]NDG87395.1 hypothetical protein [Gammaproteobacteria bacterium]